MTAPIAQGPAERKDRRRVGWWVVFDEPNDVGEVPDGFFVDEARAAKFPSEPGWLTNHLVPCWIDA